LQAGFPPDRRKTGLQKKQNTVHLPALKAQGVTFNDPQTPQCL